MLALLTLALALGAQAQVYKWVDEKGQTQYGNVPPTNVDATKVGVPRDSGPTEPAEKPKEAPVKAAKAEDGDRGARCKHERDQLKVLEAEAAILYKNEKGESVELAGEKREAAKDEVRKLIKKYCA
jgi:hypothetical protein